jgi:hypothetical protein
MYWVVSVDPHLVDAATHQRHLTTVRTQIGDEKFMQVWAEGQAMTVEEAVVYALQPV